MIVYMIIFNFSLHRAWSQLNESMYNHYHPCSNEMNCPHWGRGLVMISMFLVYFGCLLMCACVCLYMCVCWKQREGNRHTDTWRDIESVQGCMYGALVNLNSLASIKYQVSNLCTLRTHHCCDWILFILRGMCVSPSTF